MKLILYISLSLESRSEPEFFSGLCSISVAAALVLMTINCLDLRYKVTFDGTVSLELYVMKEFIHLLFLLIGTFR